MWASKIVAGVGRVLERNMGLRGGEILLIVTDTATSQEWKNQSIEKLEEMVSRNLLARTVADIAEKRFRESRIAFQSYPSSGRNAAEPGRLIEESMKLSDVVLAMTTYSISHTDARESATRSGARIASMPGVLPDMFFRGGSLSANYKRIASETDMFAKIITDTSKVRIRTKSGTNLTFSLEGRRGIADAGVLTRQGSWGNLPAGEAYAAPIEGTAEGVVVIERGWFPRLKENVKLLFDGGLLTRVVGKGEISIGLEELLQPSIDTEPYVLRRNLAEFGIGTNPNARRHDNILEAEKIRGTVHIAVGDNSHMGGNVKADTHQDFVIPFPTVEADGKTLIDQGKIVSAR